MVRLPVEETPDPLELSVRQSKRAVQGLFRNLRNATSVAAPPDGTVLG